MNAADVRRTALPRARRWQGLRILIAATAINNEGSIVGTGLYDGDADGQRELHGFLLNPL